MTEVDLKTLTMADLKQLQKDVAIAISGFKGRKKSEARMALEVHAKELGFALEDFMRRPVAGMRAKAAQKYRNPENAAVTWSGRGRKPLWFIRALAAGRTLESLSV